MSASPSSILDRASGQSPAQILLDGVSGVLLAIALQAVGILQSFGGIYQDTLDAIANVASFNIVAFFGGIGRIIQAGVVTTINSILPGQPFDLGPLTFALSIAAVGVGLFVAGYILVQPFTGDTAIGVPIDFPGLGTDEEGE